MTATCFAPSTPLPTVRQRSAPRSITRCTLAPERRASPKAPVSQPVHVLPADLPESERPPQPPRHWGVPVIGFLIEKALGTYKTPMERFAIYGPVYNSDFFIMPHTYVSDYHAITEVMRNAEVFRSKGSSPAFLRMFGENSMIILDGAEHAAVRAAFAPAFAPGVFPLYQTRILSRARSTWDSVVRMAGEREVLLAPVLRKHYLSIIIEMTSGVDMDGAYGERIPALFDDVLAMFFSPKYFPKYNAGMRARKELLEILGARLRWNLENRADTIEKLREYGEDVVKLGLKDVARGDVDMMLVSMASSAMSTAPGAAPDAAPVDSLCNSILLLWLAGFTTAAATTMNATFEIGFNAELRRQLVAEQDALVRAAGGDVAVAYEQTGAMPLLDSFLLETLRFHPAVNGMSRLAVRDVEILGRFVPKGTNIFCDFKPAHRNPALYPEPDTFKPDRFLKRAGVSKPPPILSFGPPGSAHYCIGAAFSKVLMKTTIATLLREYQYTLDPSQSREHTVFPEPSPASGIVVQSFERRKS